MIRRDIHSLCMLTAGAMLVGCGGGGSAGGSGGGTEVVNYGPVSVMAAGAIKPPVVIGSRNAVITGVFGAAFDSVTINLPPASTLSVNEALAQTSIAVDYQGQPMLYDYGTGRLSPIGSEQYYGNSSDPSISGQGGRVAVSQQSPDGPFQIFTENLDGTGKNQITNDAAWAFAPAYSPNGNTVLFERQDSANSNHFRIYSVPAKGGTATPLTPPEDNCRSAFWTPNGKIAFYRQVNATGSYSACVMDPIGTNILGLGGTYPSDSGSSSLSFFAGTGSQEGIQTFTYGGNYYLWRFSTINGGYSLGSSADEISSVSCSPVGNYAVLKRGGASGGIYLKNLLDNSEARILAGNVYSSPSWGPYAAKRSMVGTSAPLGSATGGFIFGQVGDLVQSFLVVDATTRTTIVVTPQNNPNPNQSNAVCIIQADKVTSLLYLNDLRGGVVKVADERTPIAGAVVSFNADTGRVSSVVPYTSSSVTNKPGTLSFTAKFVGAYDGAGKNRAPNGATEVTLDSKTGEIVTLK